MLFDDLLDHQEGSDRSPPSPLAMEYPEQHKSSRTDTILKVRNLSTVKIQLRIAATLS